LRRIHYVLFIGGIDAKRGGGQEEVQKLLLKVDDNYKCNFWQKIHFRMPVAMLKNLETEFLRDLFTKRSSAYHYTLLWCAVIRCEYGKGEAIDKSVISRVYGVDFDPKKIKEYLGDERESDSYARSKIAVSNWMDRSIAGKDEKEAIKIIEFVLYLGWPGIAAKKILECKELLMRLPKEKIAQLLVIEGCEGRTLLDLPESKQAACLLLDVLKDKKGEAEEIKKLFAKSTYEEETDTVSILMPYVEKIMPPKEIGARVKAILFNSGGKVRDIKAFMLNGGLKFLSVEQFVEPLSLKIGNTTLISTIVGRKNDFPVTDLLDILLLKEGSEKALRDLLEAPLENPHLFITLFSYLPKFMSQEEIKAKMEQALFKEKKNIPLWWLLINIGPEETKQLIKKK
jgi:hypothetical protein